MKRNAFISLTFAALAFLGGMLTIPYQMEAMSSILDEQEIPLSVTTLSLIAGTQAAVMTFILSMLGLFFMKRVGLQLWKRDSAQKGWKLAILFGVITALVLSASDQFLFFSLIPELAEHEVEFSLISLFAGVFYGGVVEEVMMRLFLMSFLLFLLQKVRKADSLPASSYWFIIVVTSFMFAVGHFPMTAALFDGLTPTLMIRGLLLNGIGGIFFGYLYWRYGLMFSILSHMFTHIALQLIFIPLLF